LLVNFFLQKFARKLGKPVKKASQTTMERLATYAWPGNIRELQHVIERAILLSPGDTLVLAPDFGPPTAEPSKVRRAVPTLPPRSEANSVSPALEDIERHHIETVLAQTNWMIEGKRGAAKILNLNPSTLRSRMKNLGIKRPDPISREQR
jgi:formate hydrogenlyase transcriptional activator